MVVLHLRGSSSHPTRNFSSFSTRLSHNTLETIFEPLDCVCVGYFMLLSDLGCASSSPCDTGAWSVPENSINLVFWESEFPSHSHAAVEVHPVDTNRRVILDSKIDVLADAKTKVASLRKVSFPKLVFLDFQTSLKDLLGLGTPDCDMYGNLFVSSNAERADGVAGFA